MGLFKPHVDAARVANSPLTPAIGSVPLPRRDVVHQQALVPHRAHPFRSQSEFPLPRLRPLRSLSRGGHLSFKCTSADVSATIGWLRANVVLFTATGPTLSAKGLCQSHSTGAN